MADSTPQHGIASWLNMQGPGRTRTQVEINCVPSGCSCVDSVWLKRKHKTAAVMVCKPTAD